MQRPHRLRRSPRDPTGRRRRRRRSRCRAPAGAGSCARPGTCGRRPCGRPRCSFLPEHRLRRRAVAVPSSAGSTPFSTLNSVVLPAPFGPMMPRISPSRDGEADLADRAQAAEGARQIPRPAAAARRAADARLTAALAPARAGAGIGARRFAVGTSGRGWSRTTRRAQRSMIAMIATPYTTPWMPGR